MKIHTKSTSLPLGPKPIPSLWTFLLGVVLFFGGSPSPPSQSTSKCRYRQGAFSFPRPPAPSPLGRVTLPGGRDWFEDGNGGIDGD